MDYAIIQNNKSNKKYKITSFKSYLVDQSIDIPADYFNFSWGDLDGEISKIISAGDEVWFYVNDKLVLNGLIDTFDLTVDDSTDEVAIVGRDKSSILLDNDALPTTLYNLTIDSYLKQRITPYGITKFDIEDKSPFDKIVLSAGSSEWSIIEGLCKRKGLYPRYDLELLRCTTLRSDTNFDYHFSNDFEDTIKFKNIKISVSSDIKNEILVYSAGYKRGTEFGSSDAIQARQFDSNIAIKKRRVMHERDIETTNDAQEVAKQELKLANKKAFTITIETHTSQEFFINKIAKITMKNKKLDVFMLVNKVTYSKSITAGSTTKIEFQLIEGIQTSWNNHNIPLIPR